MISPSLKRARWAVAGAGVLGVSIAWTLARAGAEVVLCDPAAAGDNASGVAAGMLAPAFEAALDPEAGLTFTDLIAARELWPDFAKDAGIAIDRAGAMLVGPDAERLSKTLLAIGAEHRSLSGAQAAALSPGLIDIHSAVFTPEDWRLDAPQALERLTASAQDAGARIVLAAVAGFDHGRVTLANGEVLSADGLVAATGWGAATQWGAILAPELDCLLPIKGQILRSRAGPTFGPVVRGPGVYVAPGNSGAVVGATMQRGVSDRLVEQSVIEGLRASAGALFADIALAPYSAAAAVRAATPDGLPLVGASRIPGVLLAAGVRRNGWLLAPMIARQILDLVSGSAETVGAFSPDRFSTAEN